VYSTGHTSYSTRLTLRTYLLTIQGTLTPGPEDEAAIAMAMKNMSTNAKEGREGSVTAGADTKVDG
tara:strand:+ start:69 stop:266 length:198 start_codon:yes stop_codon:yes gene_type:complete